jgi:hypothetical protein
MSMGKDVIGRRHVRHRRTLHAAILVGRGAGVTTERGRGCGTDRALDDRL